MNVSQRKKYIVRTTYCVLIRTVSIKLFKLHLDLRKDHISDPFYHTFELCNGKVLDIEDLLSR